MQCVPATRLAAERGSGFANVVMLGAVAASLGEPSLECLEDAAADQLGPQGRRRMRCAPRSGRDANGRAELLARSASGRASLADDRAAAAHRRLANRSRPEVELSACVNCLLCWLYCPDSAITLDGTTFTGFDYDYCKGCELCAEVCPTGAITMVEERP